MSAPRVFNFGGGVQSTAALVLAVRGEIPHRTFVFSNVGDDSESPHTLKYVREVSGPYAKKNGIELVTLQKRTKDGKPQTLIQRIFKTDRAMVIPVRLSRSGMPASRSCTAEFKVRVVQRWLKQHGATRDDPGTSALGISIDEIQRMRMDSGCAYTKLEYPLINLRIDRDECKRIIAGAGLPVPPKSSCWFCPFHSVREWARIQREEPGVFWRCVEMEKRMNDKLQAAGSDPVYFSDRLKPLDKAFSQLDLFSKAPEDC